MNENLRIRLNKIPDRIADDNFLAGRGVANEIRFHIFDYPPSSEPAVRKYIQSLQEQLRRDKPHIQFKSINLFELIVELLSNRGILGKAFEIQRNRGNAALAHALKGSIKADSIAKRLADEVDPGSTQLVLLHGLGSATPLIRTHALLESLQPLMDRTPMIVFFPGEYLDGHLRLFGSEGTDDSGGNYYRAFRLVD